MSRARKAQQAQHQKAQKRKRLRLFLIIGALFFFGVVMTDALDVFRDKDYYEVPHGNHTHYVPYDREENMPLDNFPTTPPRADQRIMPNGTVVNR